MHCAIEVVDGGAPPKPPGEVGELLAACSVQQQLGSFLCIYRESHLNPKYQRLCSTKYRMNRKTPKVIPSWLAYLEWSNHHETARAAQEIIHLTTYIDVQ